MDKDLVYYYNEMDRKYAHLSDGRWPTFRIAMNWFIQNEGKTIVETGCARLKGDWGGGLSTFLFGEWCSSIEGSCIYTVDINARNMQQCQEITKEFSERIVYDVKDSVEYLNGFNQPIDLLYLDSYDYPDGQIISSEGSMDKYNETMEALKKLPEKEIIRKYGWVIHPCQDHCLKELNAAYKNLHSKSVVLIDDNNLPGGGKSRLAKKKLSSDGWICLYDAQQSVWIRGN